MSNLSVETFCRVGEQKLLEKFEFMPYLRQSNLSEGEKNTTKELASDIDIVIKSGDVIA